MTSFTDLETSTESSRPAELYRFTMGSEEFRYTSFETQLTVAGEDFVAESISRSGISFGADQKSKDVSVIVPYENDVAQLFITVPPGEKVLTEILRVQMDEDPEFDTVALLYSGSVQSVRLSDNGTKAEITTRSIENDLNRRVPRFTYTGMCNHFLFDQYCQVDQSQHVLNSTVTAIDGETYTIENLDASGMNFVGGYIRPSTDIDFRMVVEQSGDDLILQYQFPSDLTDQSVQVFEGCDHIHNGDCATKFDNVINFGGFPFVPNKDIFQTGL